MSPGYPGAQKAGPAAGADVAALADRLARVETGLQVLAATAGGGAPDTTHAEVSALVNAVKRLQDEVAVIISHKSEGEILKQSQSISAEISQLRAQLQPLISTSAKRLPPLIEAVGEGIATAIAEREKETRDIAADDLKRVSSELRSAMAHLQSIVGTEVKSAANLLLSQARFFGSAEKAVVPSASPAKGADPLTQLLWR